MGDKTLGIYRKFEITRTDGTSASGKKHDGCDYFVIDLTHDPYAADALLAYADACESEYPLLTADLRAAAQRGGWGTLPAAPAAGREEGGT
jgi:hypothetical protein